MVRCDFCKKTIPAGTGKKYVFKTGKIIDFCSMKCEKNMLKLRRKPRTTKWTNEFHRVIVGKKA
ncbi:MAG: 50S ribosomal protein L24e [DPANN group archaeon]|nr:50S ribosomal protein L24e [DPANN group archaeon]